MAQTLPPNAVVRRLVEARPNWHVTGKGEGVSYAVDRGVLEVIAATVEDGHRTLETGAGSSTVAFLAAGAHHTAISPSEQERQRITDWCTAEGVPTDRYEHIVDSSLDVLPSMEETPLDFALVDGDHAFPAPAIDYYYSARRLKAGGIFVIDDLQLWPCRIVADFLQVEEGWEVLERTQQYASFRATEPGSALTARWWGQQQHVLNMAAPPWRRVASRIRRGLTAARQSR